MPLTKTWAKNNHSLDNILMTEIVKQKTQEEKIMIVPITASQLKETNHIWIELKNRMQASRTLMDLFFLHHPILLENGEMKNELRATALRNSPQITPTYSYANFQLKLAKFHSRASERFP
ncbi:hypothetical protein K0M31_005490 [Melipona bicolor]|uniref:Uncharacterized protein n=1 Tax=Melipona bicolor TaxID=60889 RepID=A0AA40KMR9_9HYME|nr:hypothetical protein K0M31_005490 [Melipona bicolor]